MNVMVANASHFGSVLKLRRRLWHDSTEQERQSVLQAMVAGSHPMVDDWSAAVMTSEDGDNVIGSMETKLRQYVDGSKERPERFIEDWFTEDTPTISEFFDLLLEPSALGTTAHCSLELMCDVPTDEAELLAKHEASGFEKVQRMVMVSNTIDSE